MECSGCGSELEVGYRVCPWCGRPVGRHHISTIPGSESSFFSVRVFFSAFSAVTFVFGLPALTVQAVVASAIDTSGVGAFWPYFVWTAPFTLALALMAALAIVLISSAGETSIDALASSHSMHVFLAIPVAFLLAPLLLAGFGVPAAEQLLDAYGWGCDPANQSEIPNDSRSCEMGFAHMLRILPNFPEVYWDVYGAWGIGSGIAIASLLAYGTMVALTRFENFGAGSRWQFIWPSPEGGATGMSDVHVVPSGGNWALKVDGQERDTFSTQSEAINRGRQLAEEQRGELVIHGEDGSIREKDSHGNDPRDIPG